VLELIVLRQALDVMRSFTLGRHFIHFTKYERPRQPLQSVQDSQRPRMPPIESQADDTTKKDDDTDTLRLPVELLTRIAVVLKRDRKCSSLALLASTSSLVYDLCVPHLYETIIISKRNETTFVRNVANGIKMTDQVEDDVDETAQ
jgi:hypothetical protein